MRGTEWYPQGRALNTGRCAVGQSPEMVAHVCFLPQSAAAFSRLPSHSGRVPARRRKPLRVFVIGMLRSKVKDRTSPRHDMFEEGRHGVQAAIVSGATVV